MARTAGVVNYNTFVKGLITEASPLTFPEDSTLREENFELRRDGTRARRFGMDFESSYDSTLTYTKEYVNKSVLMSYEWFNAGNSENENFLVVQVGQYLHLYNMIDNPISGNRLTTTIDLDEFIVDEVTIHRTYAHPISIAPLKGFLVVVSPVIEPIYIDYDASSSTFSVTRITIETRDLFGIEDETTSVEHRPSSLSAKHEYNLRNQGWTTANITATAVVPPSGIGVYPSNADIQHLAKQTSYDPATTGFHIEDIGDYNPNYLEKEIFGTTHAPRGKFLYNVFNREYKDLSESDAISISSLSFDAASSTITVETTDPHTVIAGDEVKMRDVPITISYTVDNYEGDSVNKTVTVTGSSNTISNKVFRVISTPTGNSFTISWTWMTNQFGNNGGFTTEYKAANQQVDSLDATNATVLVPAASIANVNEQERFRFKCTTGYAGRAWYSGLDGGDYGSYVFFSQILDSVERIGYCYQEADPTSEHISDLVDTDGGFIVIPEARNIQELVPMGQFLFVFSTNGVWRIFGDDGGNFRATGYSVEKVSDVGVNSRFSVVPVEQEIYYWAKGGIYKISQAEVSGTFNATNISQLTIQSLFFDIGVDKHKFVKGSYDPTEKKISWTYSRSTEAETTSFKYDSLLVFDTLLGAFYQYLLPDPTNDATPFLAGIFNIPDVQLIEDVSNILNGTDNVVSDLGDNVVAIDFPARAQTTQTKYLTLAESDSLNYFITFSELRDTGFLDFKSHDAVGTDAAAFMITGYDTQGSQANKKQIHHLLMYFKRTETDISKDINGNMVADNPSGCLVNVLWDWATDINSIRAGSQFQAYRLNRFYLPTEVTDPYSYGEETIVTKSKLRGRGRALSFAIQSEPGKDLHLYGWSVVVSGGRRP